ncbi:MAG: hypothetical protein HC915_19615 [Anaerolineae bacterium]|nr:hypothetical protein [Anaerolineae bacterium]
MERMKTMPVIGQILTVLDTYPRLSAWVVLSVGIVGLLVYEARDVGLSTGNWVALIIASVVVAGLCIWIVSWEDEEETPADSAIQVKSTSLTEAPAPGEPASPEKDKPADA